MDCKDGGCWYGEQEEESVTIDELQVLTVLIVHTAGRKNLLTATDKTGKMSKRQHFEV